MEIVLRSLDSVRPYERNPRDNDAAVDAVAASRREFGFRQPIVVDEQGVIIGGHTWFKAAQKLGLSETPVHVARDLSPEQLKAYRLADNKTAELAEWNLDLLPLELAELQAAEYDLHLLGFGEDELAKLLGTDLQDGLCDPDEVPAPLDEAVMQPGDLWLLGERRLLCGDSSKAEDLDRLLDGHPRPRRSRQEDRGRGALHRHPSRRPGRRDPEQGQAAGVERRADEDGLRLPEEREAVGTVRGGAGGKPAHEGRLVLGDGVLRPEPGGDGRRRTGRLSTKRSGSGVVR